MSKIENQIKQTGLVGQLFAEYLIEIISNLWARGRIYGDRFNLISSSSQKELVNIRLFWKACEVAHPVLRIQIYLSFQLFIVSVYTGFKKLVLQLS